MRTIFTIIPLFFFFNITSFGQTTILTENFDNNSQYSVTLGGEGNDGSSDYFQRTDGSNIGISYSGQDGTYFFAAQDIDDGGWTGSASPCELTWSSIDISGYTDLQFNGLFASATTNTIDNNDYIHVQYRIDGGSWINLIWFENDGSTYNTYFLEDTDFDGDGDGTQLTSTFASFTKTISGTGSTLDLRITVAVNAGGEDAAFDYFRISGTSSGDVANPTNFTASAGGSDNIDLSWDKNGSGDNVMVAYNTSDDFGTPTDGTAYSAGDNIGSATVIYNGSNTSYNHSGLSANATYYYKAWSVDGSTNYSSGVSTNATTTKAEPSNHVTNFTATANGSSQIDLSWTENDGAVVPDGYLIVASTGTVTDPTDGTDPDDDTGLTDGDGNVEVAHGTTSYSFINCSASTTYNFKIYPYTNSGSHIDFKTDGTVPSARATTEVPPVYHLIISEVADPGDTYKARFVELYNTGPSEIDFNTEVWSLCMQVNGGSWSSKQLTGSIASGETYVVAYNSDVFDTSYGFIPDLYYGSFTGNGDDGYFLYKDGDNSSGTLVDAYGVIDEDGTGKAWEYKDSRAYRQSTVMQANPTWTESEWVIESAGVDDMTPGNFPEIVDSNVVNGTGEYDFNSVKTGFKMNVTSITGSDNFSARYIKGRGPKHATGITESHIGKFAWHFVKGNNITDIHANLKFYVSKFPENSVQEGANDVKLYKRETFGNGDFTLVGTLTYYDNGTQGDQSDDWLEYDGITSFSEFVMASNNAPLPVELTSFTANVKGNKVELNWATATEVNNYGFEIQRSVAGVQSLEWETIGFVEGHGSSNSPKYYSYVDNPIDKGFYSYKLKQIDLDGAFKYSDVVSVDLGSVTKFALKQNYPNPFNPTTEISFDIPKESNVRLSVYNSLGQKVADLVNEKLSAGTHRVKFDGSKLASGIYFYKMESGGFTDIKKMILMK